MLYLWCWPANGCHSLSISFPRMWMRIYGNVYQYQCVLYVSCSHHLILWAWSRSWQLCSERNRQCFPSNSRLRRPHLSLRIQWHNNHLVPCHLTPPQVEALRGAWFISDWPVTNWPFTDWPFTDWPITDWPIWLVMGWLTGNWLIDWLMCWLA